MLTVIYSRLMIHDFDLVIFIHAEPSWQIKSLTDEKLWLFPKYQKANTILSVIIKNYENSMHAFQYSLGILKKFNWYEYSKRKKFRDLYYFSSEIS